MSQYGAEHHEQRRRRVAGAAQHAGADGLRAVEHLKHAGDRNEHRRRA